MKLENEDIEFLSIFSVRRDGNLNLTSPPIILFYDNVRDNKEGRLD